MALGNHRSSNKRPAGSSEKRRAKLQSVQKRNALLESLESRHLMAGPQLIGVQPDVGDLLLPGQNNVRNVAPRELVFRFDDSQVIDESTLAGIRVTRSGGDGTFGQPSATTDFASANRSGTTIVGGAEVLLLGADPDLEVRFTVNQTLPLGAAPQFPTVQIGTRQSVGVPAVPTVVTAAVAPGTTVKQLIDAINSAPALTSVMSAQLRGGMGSSVVLADPATTSIGPILLNSNRDIQMTPGAALVSESPNDNEVTLRFADALPDDVYKIEVFGFDDPTRGIVGLRNSNGASGQGEFLVPRTAGARKEELNLTLDLGPRVEAVVPQPLVRGADGRLSQRRNEVVVYFNDDNLFIENDANGNPTQRSAENPRFYSLILTNESVSNLDDQTIQPSKVIYNPQADTATLVFDQDLANLFGGLAGADTLRLRIGTAESLPLAPAPVNLGGRVASVNLTGTSASLVLETREEGRPVTVNFVTGMVAGVAAAGNTVTVTLAGGETLANVVTLLQGNAQAAAMLNVTVNGASATLVNPALLPLSANLLEIGGTFDTASSIGTFTGGPIVSRQINSAIDPQGFEFELIGGNDDPGHREFSGITSANRDQHINSDYGADVVRGVTTVPYNFKANYVAGRTNAISDRQKDRVREALDLWGQQLGIQFVETASRGLTFARGDLTALPFSADRYVRNDLSFAVQVDSRIAQPNFDLGTTDATLVLDGLRSWNDRYGEDFFRTTMAGIGFLLGLEGAPELPANTLMSLSSLFLSGNTSTYLSNVGSQRLEPVFPGNADIIHGQYLYRPEANDVDLYRFNVALDGPNKRGELSVETFAERLGTSSLLDTTVTLYKQVQASLETDFSLNRGVKLRLQANAAGLRGNRVSLQFVVTPNGPSAPQVTINPADPNAIVVYTSNPGDVSFQQLADAINNHPGASGLVTASLINGDGVDPATVKLTNFAEDTVPLLLTGGRVEAIAWNDDYYSEDSFLKADLANGTYYIAVASQGNDNFNPVEANSGNGGKTQGDYQLLVKFRPQVDETDVIRDLDGNNFATASTLRLPGSPLDGDSDGVQGGVYDFWFQTRPLNRRLVVSGGDRLSSGQTIEITDARGIIRRFELTTSGVAGPNRIPVTFSPSDSGATVAAALRTAIATAVCKWVSMSLATSLSLSAIWPTPMLWRITSEPLR